VRTLTSFLAGAAALALLVAGGGYIFLHSNSSGFSTREKPSTIEAAMAREARGMAVPAGAREKANPVPNDEQTIAEGRAHWADHCALCHANDGSGQTEMGKQMYPPAPDMRQAATQDMTDGELFYIIQNGIRLTGMPAWGSGSIKDEQDTWKLVRFIRHLPALSAAELEQMKALNPRSPQEMREEQEEKDFLNGGELHEHEEHHHH